MSDRPVNLDPEQDGDEIYLHMAEARELGVFYEGPIRLDYVKDIILFKSILGDKSEIDFSKLDSSPRKFLEELSDDSAGIRESIEAVLVWLRGWEEAAERMGDELDGDGFGNSDENPDQEARINELLRNPQIKRLLRGIEMSDGGGGFVLLLPSGIKADEVLLAIDEALPGLRENRTTIMRVHKIDQDLRDEKGVVNKAFSGFLDKMKDEKNRETIFFIDGSIVDSGNKERLEEYVAFLNGKRDTFCRAGIGSVLIIPAELEVVLSNKRDLTTCLSYLRLDEEGEL